MSVSSSSPLRCQILRSCSVNKKPKRNMEHIIASLVFIVGLYIHWAEVVAQCDASDTTLSPGIIGTISDVCDERNNGLEEELINCMRKLPQVILTPISECAKAGGYMNVKSLADDICQTPVHTEPIITMRTCLAVRFQDQSLRTVVWQNIAKLMAVKSCARQVLGRRGISLAERRKVEREAFERIEEKMLE